MGTKIEPFKSHWAYKMPNVSQWATKMHERIDLQTRSRKGRQNGQRISEKRVPKWKHIPPKINKNIDTESDAEHILKIEET